MPTESGAATAGLLNCNGPLPNVPYWPSAVPVSENTLIVPLVLETWIRSSASIAMPGAPAPGGTENCPIGTPNRVNFSTWRSVETELEPRT